MYFLATPGIGSLIRSHDAIKDYTDEEGDGWNFLQSQSVPGCARRRCSNDAACSATCIWQIIDVRGLAHVFSCGVDGLRVEFAGYMSCVEKREEVEDVSFVAVVFVAHDGLHLQCFWVDFHCAPGCSGHMQKMHAGDMKLW